MLRKIRVVIAILSLLAVTLLFLDFTGTAQAWLGWMARIQFIPAVLALNVVVVVALVVATLLMGRIYCSVICPLGIFQDVVSRIHGFSRKARNRFGYSPAKSWLRLAMLVIFVGSLAAGGLAIGVIARWIEPYSAFGRMVHELLGPVWIWGNNLLAAWAERADSYLFYSREAYLRSGAVLTTAIVTFVVISILAWRNGRTWCNTICPVGTILGTLARYSLLAPVINTAKCNGCTLCARRCKASCIDAKAHAIDYSRCVACMDCIDNCRQSAISYTLRRKAAHPVAEPPAEATETTEAASTSRREFLTVAALATGTALLKAEEKTTDGGLAAMLDKKVPRRNTPIVPPGALSLRNLSSHCTACQLCVTACPNHVLRPSTNPARLMQPEAAYERGFCRPECTRCSDVCPTGAIHPITREHKSATQIGHAVWLSHNCLPMRDGVSCGNCARHCPTGAITMAPSNPADPDSPAIPLINEARCIGCGACEYVCPSRPFSAIYVEGHLQHKTV